MISNRFWLRVKKAATILLVLCFFMPLSKCESKVDTQGKVVSTETYTYPYETADGVLAGMVAGKISAALWLIAILGVFFLPLVCSAFSSKWQSIAHVAGSLAAQYCLYLMTFWYQGIQFGGALAIACWWMLFLAGWREIWRRWRTGYWSGKLELTQAWPAPKQARP